MWLSLFFNPLEEQEQAKTIIFSASPYGMPVISHYIDSKNEEEEFEPQPISSFNA